MTPLSGSANAAHPPQDKLLPNPKARLQDQFHEVARFKHLSSRSERAYWEWVVRFLKFHRDRAGGWRHPRDLGSRAVTPFLTWLATGRDVAVSTRCPGGIQNALVVLDCGGKRSATPLSHARRSSAAIESSVRPKAPSPLPLCRRSPKSSIPN